MIPEKLLEDAASRSRVSMATRWNRVKSGWRRPVQAALAVALAWAVAKGVWGHDSPFFAPVSAIIAIGQSYYERGRRAAELVLSVTLGVAVADVLAFELGTGIPQLGLAVFIATTLGMFFGTSALFVNQVAISAVLVFTIMPPADGFSFARSLDALTGGLIALAVTAVVLPSDPIRILRAAARPVLDELAGTLRDIAAAVRRRSPEDAEEALKRARGIDEFGERFFAATQEGRSTARLRPTRRRTRDTVEFYADAAARVDLAVRNVRVLARGTIRALELDENVPPEVADALEDLGAAVEALAAALDSGRHFDAVREPALRAAATATRVLDGTTNMSVSVIVGQIRSTATDLLTGIGLTYEEASGAVRAASRT